MTLLLVAGFMQQAQPPTFRTSASIVPVDVRVIDKSGKAVTDLTKANFTVSEDGVPQTITQFEKDSGDDPTHPVRRKVVEAPGVGLDTINGVNDFRGFRIARTARAAQKPYTRYIAGTVILNGATRVAPRDQTT